MLDNIRKNTVEILHESELQGLLNLGRTLVVKCGFDPTAPDLHLGHAVLLRKLRQVQDLGHHVVFVVGDFTASIGDPTGRNAQRPPLTKVEIDQNAETFQAQVFTILDKGKTSIVHNSTWLESSSRMLIELMASFTVSQMLEREDFSRRFRNEQPIHMHELVYPMLQGFDSVALAADIELGGTDQKFNLLMGRELQRQRGQKPQVVITMPIINGLDGVSKMSKSLGNHVGLAEAPSMQFGKLMSIPDDLMASFRRLLTDLPEGTGHPKDQKKEMTHAVVTMLHGKEEADRAQTNWEVQFEQHGVPEMETIAVAMPLEYFDEGWIIRLDKTLVAVGLSDSNSEANRMIKAGAVAVDGRKSTTNKFWVEHVPSEVILRNGRNWKRVSLLPEYCSSSVSTPQGGTA